MLRSILYATDLGLYAPYVLQHALSLARAFQAELHVVHAVEPLGLFAESVLNTYLDEKTLEELRSKGLTTVMASIEQRVLEGFRDEVGEAQQDMQMIRSVRVAQGDPAQVILEEARKLGVDLLVVGSHSHGAAQDIPLGRTAARLLQLAETPVYLVPMLQHR
ncbi:MULTISPECIES: universal stress protein [Pseudomonas]|jgi:nucleotide-binding universal stress UspA family protein|uniref:universal stress protein n=1 Tax=Pseudomonas TaxID=286 RepID=UPI001C8033C4|nr:MULTISPECIES: universal stress protein [Pseudomonas]MDG9927049.1 universal stress protein [Pseudomonas sp. GD04042]MDH0482942.1 universal stress protein [Pseudomonas sp. GD04015]MDH0602464.1 universal stress protein [Pseudomonas sp. GD03869]MDH0894161.1 universal stress protein [Pseudomonas sp. GD03875]MDH1062916.1 universal stress protein [Pseudomonas sp. GD03985]